MYYGIDEIMWCRLIGCEIIEIRKFLENNGGFFC